MSSGKWRVKSSEIERAIKAARAAGLHVRSVEIATDGTIKINIGDPTKDSPDREPNEWDEVFEDK